MTRERLYLFDTTLRDGAQTQGVDFSVQDKHSIALAIDRIGVDYVEGGWPGANPTDTSFFAAPPMLARAKLIAFGMTKRSGRSAANDPGLAQVLDAKSQGTCLVGKSWDFHVTLALGIPLEENLALIRESIGAAAAKGEALFDAEHFFDGYKANPDLRAAMPESGGSGRGALDGALRHQWRHAAKRGRTHCRRGGAACAGRAPRHPRT